MEQALMGISAVARFAGCSEKTVRAREGAGVVTAIRDSAGRRLFTMEQAHALRAHVARRRKA
jgi:DNA-binding transcriptional MerR regulator